jgi:solute carrier family 25 carnitine/acylcarnitine transporter 20/29
MDDLKLLIPGFVQGLTRVSISYPFDVIKVHLQKLLFKNTFTAVTHIYKSDPFKFYRGSSLAFVSVGIDRSIQFYLMEKLNKIYNPYINGVIISLIGSIYNVPIQLLTTNIALNVDKKINLIHFCKNMYKNNGIYKGYILEMVKNQIGSSIFMGTYYLLRNKFDNKPKYSMLYGAIAGMSLWPIIYPIDTIRTEYQTSNKSIKEIIIHRYLKYGILSYYKGLIPIMFRSMLSASIGMLSYEYVRSKIT